MTLDDFLTWYRSAEPGDSCVYHQGRLWHDRLAGPQFEGIATKVLLLAGYEHSRTWDEKSLRWKPTGECRLDLVQRRTGPMAYDYIAIRRSEP